ncbi:MAG: DegT/DnrJ/EryC1/StrS aminotransferase family protein [Pseudomonadota bacterium]|nr:DegT/DnrJ/EryC1/StrS aminotransferase family protein [Pseudomonadota bacterium]
MSSIPASEGGTSVRNTFLVFGRPDIREAEIGEVLDSIRSGWVGTGPKTAQFQENFRKYVTANYAQAVNSCTAALHLSVIAGDIQAADEVITTPMTFCATSNVICHAGAIPIFADIDLETLNISPDAIEACITPKTRAILPVHFAGRPCNMNAIREIARKHNLIIIDDCAHAIEAYYGQEKIGSMADFSCFSFYVTKNMTTVEGGLVTTNNEEAISRIRRLSLHGLTKDAWKRFSDDGYKHYEVIEPGFKYNMTDIQAAFGLHQLQRIEENLKIRQKIWKIYDQEFASLPIIPQSPTDSPGRHARHLYTLILDINNLHVSRDAVIDALTKENIGVGVHYISIHRQPYYQDRFGIPDSRLPNATFISDRTLSLPLSSGMTKQDTYDVVTAVKKILNYYKR